MQYIHVIDGRVNSVTPEFDPVFPGIPIEERYHADFLAQCVIAPDDAPIEAGWLYDEVGGMFIESTVPEPESPAPAELRKLAYETECIVSWEGQLITIDAAGALWLHYAAEDSEKAAELTTLIAEAKAVIRSQYPDA